MEVIELIDSNTNTNEFIKKIIERKSEKECEDAFFVVDTGDVIRKYNQWKSLLPAIEPFYAVKCNRDKTVLALMASLGMSFDCASKMEIETMLSLGVPPSRIIYTNPHKQKSHIIYARDNDVDVIVFDCEEELDKINKIFHNARLLLRILPVAKVAAAVDLGTKYGATDTESCRLLQLAKERGQNVIGVCFHVGWACKEMAAYESAIRQSKVIFDYGKSIGHPMQILDIGGGFLGKHEYHHFFQEIRIFVAIYQYLPGGKLLIDCLGFAFDQHVEAIYRLAKQEKKKVSKTITMTLQDIQANEKNIKVIAEPGTYFVESAYTLVVNVIGKRKRKTDEDSVTNYHLNEGMFGSFTTYRKDYGYGPSHPVPLKPKTDKVYRCVLWGPTCDSLDRFAGEFALPELEIGEWLLFSNMGAYTTNLQTDFNGMPKSKCLYFCNVGYSETCGFINTLGVTSKNNI